MIVFYVDEFISYDLCGSLAYLERWVPVSSMFVVDYSFYRQINSHSNGDNDITCENIIMERFVTSSIGCI